MISPLLLDKKKLADMNNNENLGSYSQYVTSFKSIAYPSV